MQLIDSRYQHQQRENQRHPDMLLGTLEEVYELSVRNGIYII
jgi:NTP pyrophosphatase (non-canonical NTP hydrolase)